jgi:hypothetical protein
MRQSIMPALPNSYYATGCACHRARLTLLTPLFPRSYESRPANFYQQLSPKNGLILQAKAATLFSNSSFWRRSFFADAG